MRYDIVYSITAHESIECVYNLYENILQFNPGLNCLVIFHVNPLLFSQIDQIPARDNLWFHPAPTEKNRFSWSILLAHLANYDLVRDINFDFFCLLASNCMFVRSVDYERIRSTTPVISPAPHEFAKDVSINFENIEQEWFWSVFLQCQEMVDLFQANRIGVNARSHEGAYFRKDVFAQIYAFCEHHIWGASCVFLPDGIGWEELIIPSLEKYLTGQLGTRYCKHFPYDREITEAELLALAASQEHYNIVKRVERSMESSVRRFICTRL